MINPVSTFTPVQTESKFSMLPALYLSPLTCNREIAIFKNIDTEGNHICTLETNNTTFTATALKIATYILSVGILPLLAFVLNLAIRCGSNYHYDELEQGQPDSSIPNPAGSRLGQNQPAATAFEKTVETYMTYDLYTLEQFLAALADDGDEFNKNAINNAILTKKQAGTTAPTTTPVQPNPVQEPVDEQLVQQYLNSGMSIDNLLAIRNNSEHASAEQRAVDEVIKQKRAQEKLAGAGAIPPAPGRENKQQQNQDQIYQNKISDIIEIAVNNNYYDLKTEDLRAKYWEENGKYTETIDAYDQKAENRGSLTEHSDKMAAIESVLNQRGEAVTPGVKVPIRRTWNNLEEFFAFGETQKERIAKEWSDLRLVEPVPNLLQVQPTEVNNSAAATPGVKAAPQTSSTVISNKPAEVAPVVLPPMDPNQVRAKRLATLGGGNVTSSPPKSPLLATASAISPAPTPKVAAATAPTPAASTKVSDTSQPTRSKTPPPVATGDSTNLSAISREEREKENVRNEQLRDKTLNWSFMKGDYTLPSPANLSPKSDTVQPTEPATAPVLTPASPEGQEMKTAGTMAANLVGSVLDSLRTSDMELSPTVPLQTSVADSSLTSPPPPKTLAEGLGFDPTLLKKRAKKINRKSTPGSNFVLKAPAKEKETTPVAATPAEPAQQGKNIGNFFLEEKRRRDEKVAAEAAKATPKPAEQPKDSASQTS